MGFCEISQCIPQNRWLQVAKYQCPHNRKGLRKKAGKLLAGELSNPASGLAQPIRTACDGSIVFSAGVLKNHSSNCNKPWTPPSCWLKLMTQSLQAAEVICKGFRMQNRTTSRSLVLHTHICNPIIFRHRDSNPGRSGEGRVS